ncbi:hypothetical protein [Streptomyces parvulus]|uniref:hypothetical protein n=1 Tax=Streptomyces parvulus TaxID=146923 RepID=UPI0033ABE63B
MFVLHEPALANDLIESESEFLEGYDGKGRPVQACGEPGEVHLELITAQPRPDRLRALVERYYAVFATRHPTRIPPQREDLVAFIQAVSKDWIEE